MKTTTNHRTAIRVYAHQLKVIGFENDKHWGIVHYTDGCSQLWTDNRSCFIDRRVTEIFLNNGIDETEARALLVAMLKAAIAERGLETKN